MISLLLLPLLLGIGPYREALPGYSYQFPRDHFEHQDFRTEWWYYTGNVTDAAGERYGFELVFFRQGENRRSDSKSAWAVQDVYLAHAALTDAKGKQFWYEERLNRAGPGVAGASFDKHRIWNGNWQSVWDGETQTLDAITEHFKFHLQLRPEKPFVIQGENGVSQKGEGKGRASHYVSFPLLKATGNINGKPVTGKAWMDHEWFTEQLAPDQVGWDWFSIQLDNNTELMLFELRKKDGSLDEHSAGTYIDEKAHHLLSRDFKLTPIKYWQKYPVQWRIQIPSLGIDITSKAVLEDQELKGPPGYWEGAVDYKGTRSGAGYIEMTGYNRPVKLEDLRR
jgi:predicted secreted hydrolase